MLPQVKQKTLGRGRRPDTPPRQSAATSRESGPASPARLEGQLGEESRLQSISSPGLPGHPRGHAVAGLRSPAIPGGSPHFWGDVAPSPSRAQVKSGHDIRCACVCFLDDL